MAAMTASHGDIRAVSDAEILDAYRWLAAHEGVFCEPASAAGVAGLLRTAPRARARIVCVLTGHGLKDPQIALGHAGSVVPCEPDDRRGREGRARVVRRRRRIRVPASSANLGPGFDVLAAALALHVEVEVVETGRFGVVTDLSIARDRRNLVVRGFAPPAPARRLRVPHPLRRPALRRARHQRRGLRRRAARRRLDLRARRRPARRSRSSSRAIRDNVAAALLGGFVLCADGAPSASTRPPGSRRCSSSRTAHVRTAKARAALPAEVPMADAVFNVAHAALLVLGLAQGRLDLVARGLADRLHQPRRARLYPESLALVAPRDGARRARRHDLRRRPDRAGLEPVRRDARGVVERLRAEADGLGGRHARAVRAAGRRRAGSDLAQANPAHPSMRSRGLCASGYSFLFCVLCVAAAVLFSSETQRNTSTTTYAEAKTAQQLLSSFLNRERALDGTLDTGSQSALEDYVARGRPDGVAAAPRGRTSLPTTSPSSRRSRASAPPTASGRAWPSASSPPAACAAGRRAAPRAPARRLLRRQHRLPEAARGQPRRGGGRRRPRGGLADAARQRPVRDRRRAAGRAHAPSRAPAARRAHRRRARPRTRSAPPRCASPRRCR